MDVNELISGFSTVPRVKPIPEIPEGPDSEQKLDREIFGRFPDCGWYARMGIAVPNAGDVDLVLLWGEGAPPYKMTRIVAFLLKPLPFNIEVTRRQSLCVTAKDDFERECSVRSSDEETSSALLFQPALRQAILDFIRTETSPGISASHVTCQVGGADRYSTPLEGMKDPAVTNAIMRCAALVLKIFKD